MLSHSSQEKNENTFVITQNKDSISYELKNSKELKAIEISSDLYRAKFYFYEPAKNERNFDREQKAIKHTVLHSVDPHMPEIGSTICLEEFVEIYGMEDYSSMSQSNKKHIESQYSIANQLHSLEWVLTKAKHTGLLSQDLYDKIRIDVRHRALQLREIENANKASLQQMVDEVSEKYSSPTNFKQITQASDTNEFAGKIIAFTSDSSYFSAGDNNVITMPTKVHGQKIKFAKLQPRAYSYENGETGFNMDCFLKPNGVDSTHALIDEKIKEDSGLSMRLATREELEFLRSLVELDQGGFEYQRKKDDLASLEKEIDKASSAPSVSQFSLFSKKKSAVIPPFSSFTTGAVDWPRQTEKFR